MAGSPGPQDCLEGHWGILHHVIWRFLKQNASIGCVSSSTRMEKYAFVKSITEKYSASKGMEVRGDGTSGTMGAMGITKLFMALKSCTNL